MAPGPGNCHSSIRGIPIREPLHPSCYLLTQASSLQLQQVSPGLYKCQWLNDDDTICGRPITWKTVAEHLSTHGIKRMSRSHQLTCRWAGCHLRGGGKATIKRENIVRHVRERHLGGRRGASNQTYSRVSSLDVTELLHAHGSLESRRPGVADFMQDSFFG